MTGEEDLTPLIPEEPEGPDVSFPQDDAGDAFPWLGQGSVTFNVSMGDSPLNPDLIRALEDLDPKIAKEYARNVIQESVHRRNEETENRILYGQLNKDDQGISKLGIGAALFSMLCLIGFGVFLVIEEASPWYFVGVVIVMGLLLGYGIKGPGFESKKSD